MSKSVGRLAAVAIALLVLVVAATGGTWRSAAQAAEQSSGQGAAGSGAGANADWRVYLGGAARTNYVPLNQIDKSNVGRLRQVWSYDTGDRGEYQSNNLVVRGVLYTASPARKVIALDAATGRELWKWDPVSERSGNPGNRQRGLVYWEDETGGDARIFTSAGNYLYAIDAGTGTVIRSFGNNGALHLGTGGGATLDGPPASITLNTPGVIYKDMYLVAGINDGPGSVRAYDVRTGAVRWVFHTIPRRSEVGYDTWPAGGPAASGGASNWSGTSLDEARGILYVPTESATPDFWRASVYGENHFGNSLIALDANTGKRLWHYQIVHHDLLDKDLPTPPVLLTVTHNGRRIDAVAQGTKHGLLFVFDRVTGEPLWPIEERPVPASELPEARTWPTQPFPTKPAPLMRQVYTQADVSNISPTARAATQARLAVSGSVGAFPGPSLRERILFPGFDGGMEWGGGAADPGGIYYVNTNEVPWLYQLIPTRRADGSALTPGERTYLSECAACHGVDRGGEAAHQMPSLANVATTRTKDAVHALLESGGGRMPSFGGLSETQRRAVVDFLFDDEQPAAVQQGRRGGGRGEGVGGPGGGGRGGAVPEPPPYAFAGFRRWRVEGYPAISPPWGKLNAVDLNTGEIKWQVPLGEYPELTAKGIPPTGAENYGGPVVSASGLIFIAASDDGKFRVFDKETGAKLWEAELPFSGHATPTVYMVDGKQYVAISAGGGKSGRPAGGLVVAFALPD